MNTNYLNTVARFTTTLASIRGALYDQEITLRQAIHKAQQVRYRANKRIRRFGADDMAVIKFRQVALDSQMLENGLLSLTRQG